MGNLQAAAGSRAADDVKAELVIDRIATEEKIDVTDEELTMSSNIWPPPSGESAEVLRARLTKQGTLDRMKAKLRSDKTIDWLAQNASVKTVAAEAPSEILTPLDERTLTMKNYEEPTITRPLWYPWWWNRPAGASALTTFTRAS